MKVICIDNKNSLSSRRFGQVIKELVEGNTYEVRQCSLYKDSYLVRGISIGFEGYRKDCYRKDRFIPISNIDEKEILEQRQTQYA